MRREMLPGSCPSAPPAAHDLPATKLITPRWLDAMVVAGYDRVHGLATLHRARRPSAVKLGGGAARGLREGDIVRPLNDRGACRYDPVRDAPGEVTLCGHGNPNILTRDAGTSSLAQGAAAN